jgi:hypothetical protein
MANSEKQIGGGLAVKHLQQYNSTKNLMSCEGTLNQTSAPLASFEDCLNRTKESIN